MSFNLFERFSNNSSNIHCLSYSKYWIPGCKYTGPISTNGSYVFAPRKEHTSRNLFSAASRQSWRIFSCGQNKKCIAIYVEPLRCYRHFYNIQECISHNQLKSFWAHHHSSWINNIKQHVGWGKTQCRATFKSLSTQA